MKHASGQMNKTYSSRTFDGDMTFIKQYSIIADSIKIGNSQSKIKNEFDFWLMSLYITRGTGVW